MTTAAAPTTLGLTLTQLARQSSARLSGTPYRSADTGRWCSPTTPHVPGCVCPPGGEGCDACWAAWLHHIAT